MALITKPLNKLVEVVPEAHIAMTILAMAAAVVILYFGRIFFITSLTALIIAFILEPFVALLMRVRFPRSLASFLVCTMALAFLYVIGMGAYSQLAGLYSELPKYGQRIGSIVDGVQQKISGTLESGFLNDNLIKFSLSGDAKIIGVGNGDPSSHEPDKCEEGKWQTHLFNGKCQVNRRISDQQSEKN